VELPVFRALLSSRGQAAIQAAMALEPREVDFLVHFSSLSRQYPSELARAALEIAILRREAAAKFPFAERMYFTREGLEQATAYEVSTYRAKRYRPFPSCLDLGCSLGGDTLALASLIATLGVDKDELRLNMARANLESLGLGERVTFIQADLNDPLPFQSRPGVALFLDPARRSGGKRIYSVNDYQPALKIVGGWLEHFSALGVKISPGVKREEISHYDAELEFISLHGELKEAVLWFGSLKNAKRRATLLPGEHSLAFEDEPDLPVEEPRAYLYEPDPAILRAGMVRNLGQILDAAQLDPEIAYLTADTIKPTPFARVWAVLDWFPFGLKRLRSYLREQAVGQVVVKKRGSPLQPEVLIRDLRLKGEQERVLFLTQLRGRPIVIICLPQP
jgi:SAM-dependent methyltransferase